MAHWTIEAPTSLDFEDVTGLRVRLIAGSVAVLATDGTPSLAVTVTVPRNCPVQVGVVSATAVLSAISARASVKSVSGEITLDGLSGDVDAHVDLDALGGMHVTTVSGEVTLRLPAETDAQVHLHSMSGGVRSEFAE